MKKEVVTILYYSKSAHVCQILTGLFTLFGKSGVRYKIDPSFGQYIDVNLLGCVIVEYKRKVFVFDAADGYQDTDGILNLYNLSDFYFKRSFNRDMNASLGVTEHIYPLGFNYYVSLPWIPIQIEPFYRRVIVAILYPFRRVLFHCGGKNILYHFLRSEEVFSFLPSFSVKMRPTVFFLNRLWPGNDELNNIRIQIIRRLREMLGNHFIGGLVDTPLSREQAPDLIVDKTYTLKGNYTRLMHQSDICIGSEGLHHSIGWKVGEYVAASKAIIAERFYYELPGDWKEGYNYLAFRTVDECISHVIYLLENPSEIVQMQKRNYDYYQNYLKPDKMLQNAFRVVDGGIKPNDTRR